MLKCLLSVKNQKLATFLGYPSLEKIELILDSVIPNFEINYNEALNFANQYHSQLIRQEKEVFEAEMNVAKVKSDNRFNFNLNASFGLSQTADNISEAYIDPQNQEFVSLGVNVPIIQWGLGRGRIKQAQANAELVKSNIEQEKIDFNQGVYVTVALFNLNRKQLKVSKRANEVASKRFEVAKQRYLIGKTIVTDLQIAQQEKDIALISYINSYRNFWKSYYDIRKTTHYDFEAKSIIEN
jgi:outer membrane protein TolC